MPLAEVEVDVDRVGDLLAAVRRRGHEVAVELRECRVHLGRALEIELAGVHPHAGCIAAESPRVHAEQDILRLGVLAVDVMAVAGRNGRDAQLAGDFKRHIGDLPLQVQPVVLDLDEIPVPESLLKPAGNLPGLRERLTLLA